MGIHGIDTIDFYYATTRYVFHAEKRVASGKVNIGRFTEDAPYPLEVNKLYCLKEVKVSDPTDETWAADRECYDIVPFQGSHLRQILLQDDSAKKVAKQIKEKGRFNEFASCKVIEPYYYSLKDYFTHCDRYSVATRLDIVLQFARGSEELSRGCNQIGGVSVLAHRDLKWENGVAEAETGHPHIRLVDFATIWLNRNADRSAIGTKKASGTKKGAVSPENTCPESVITRFAVSDKTDVYALGMMLASLFMLHKGKYVNPNALWLKKNGWDNDRALGDAFRRCLRDYKSASNPGAAESWIEQDFKAQDMQLYWEDLGNKDVLDRIRALFQKATLIMVGNRMSRADFIKELEKIKSLVEGSTDTRRLPVSIYLFNGTNAQNYKEDYQLAAEKVFQREADDNDGAAVHALCISYTNPRPEEKPSQCLQVNPPCCTEEVLRSNIQAIEPGRAADSDLLIYGIHAAAAFLHRHKDRFWFTGQVYLFTPRVPTEDKMHPFFVGGQALDLQALCEQTLDKLCGTYTQFCAFSPEQPDPQVEDWCEYQLLQKVSRPDPTPRPTPVANTDSNATFNVSSTAPYITLPDGKKVFVGIIRNSNR